MKVLITGFTGSLGSQLVPRLLDEGHEVIGVSRCELKQSQFPKHPSLITYLCDVRDRDRLLEASRGVEMIYHLAALKRIESAEEQPEAAIATNITGTENVLFAQRMNKIRRVVFVSSDKACLPITAYGATKQVGERLVLRNPNNTVCRYGNVLGSRGSVLQAFAQSISAHGTFSLTDRRCSRFWWRIQDAAEYVKFCSDRPDGGLCIPELKAAPVAWLGRAVAEALGNKDACIEEIGLRGKEKLHEDLRSDDEGGAVSSGDPALWFTPKELLDLVTPLVAS